MANMATAAGEWSRDDERTLVERHRYGDAAAFDELYHRYAQLVYNLALRLAGDVDEAEDWSQEVFLRIHRHLGKFRSTSSLKTWIYRVTLNHCRSRLGRRRRWFWTRLSESPEAEAHVAVDGRRDPEARAVAGELSRVVAEALARVPARYREAVVLRDLEGLTYDEIATVLGIRIGTVRSRIARGRDRLKDLLEEQPT